MSDIFPASVVLRKNDYLHTGIKQSLQHGRFKIQAGNRRRS